MNRFGKSACTIVTALALFEFAPTFASAKLVSIPAFPIASKKIAAPTGLTQVANSAQCQSLPSNGSSVCSAAIKSGEAVFLWQWAPCANDPLCVKSVDGYRIYLQGSNTSLGSAASSPIGQNTYLGVANRQVSAGGCYVVRAFVANQQSLDSNAACTRIALLMPTQKLGTITLSTPTPNPSRSKVFTAGTLGIEPDYVTPPFGLSTTRDLNECRQHEAGAWGIGCAAAMQNSWYILVWQWRKNPPSCPNGKVCVTDVDGYRIYFPGNNAPPVTVAQGTDYTAQAFDPKATTGSCFAVSAYKQNLESARTNTLCASSYMASSPIQLPQHKEVIVQPLHMRFADQQNGHGTSILNIFKSTIGPVPDDLNNNLIAGYVFVTSKSTWGDEFMNDIKRGAVAFDLSFLANHPIDFATFHLHVKKTTMGAQYQANYDRSCAVHLGVASGQWWYDVGWLEGVAWQSIPMTGPDIYVDVTGIIDNNFAQARENGFVIRGQSEDLSSFTEASCQTTYDTATLDVSYGPGVRLQQLQKKF